MKKGDVIVVSGTTIGKVISGITEDKGSRWGHVALALNSQIIIEADWDGVVTISKDTFFNRYDRWKILRPFENIIDTNKLVKDAKSYIGAKYGFLQLFVDFWYVIVNKITGTEHRRGVKTDMSGVVCSELVAKCLKEQGLWVVDGIEPPLIEPEEFARCTKLFLIGKDNQDY